jgi:hypothetical protein
MSTPKFTLGQRVRVTQVLERKTTRSGVKYERCIAWVPLEDVPSRGIVVRRVFKRNGKVNIPWDNESMSFTPTGPYVWGWLVAVDLRKPLLMVPDSGIEAEVTP